METEPKTEGQDVVPVKEALKEQCNETERVKKDDVALEEHNNMAEQEVDITSEIEESNPEDDAASRDSVRANNAAGNKKSKDELQKDEVYVPKDFEALCPEMKYSYFVGIWLKVFNHTFLLRADVQDIMDYFGELTASTASDQKLTGSNVTHLKREHDALQKLDRLEDDTNSTEAILRRIVAFAKNEQEAATAGESANEASAKATEDVSFDFQMVDVYRALLDIREDVWQSRSFSFKFKNLCHKRMTGKPDDEGTITEMECVLRDMLHSFQKTCRNGLIENKRKVQRLMENLCDSSKHMELVTALMGHFNSLAVDINNLLDVILMLSRHLPRYIAKKSLQDAEGDASSEEETEEDGRRESGEEAIRDEEGDVDETEEEVKDEEKTDARENEDKQVDKRKNEDVENYDAEYKKWKRTWRKIFGNE